MPNGWWQNVKHALRRARAKAKPERTRVGATEPWDADRDACPAPSTTFEDLVTVTSQIAGRPRLTGQTPDGATRRISLHDRDARPIAKGRLGKPVECGTMAQLLEGDDGVIVDRNVEHGGNPAAPAIGRVRNRARGLPRTEGGGRVYRPASWVPRHARVLVSGGTSCQSIAGVRHATPTNHARNGIRHPAGPN
jgi:IS5 family transposase